MAPSPTREGRGQCSSGMPSSNPLRLKRRSRCRPCLIRPGSGSAASSCSMLPLTRGVSMRISLRGGAISPSSDLGPGIASPEAMGLPNDATSCIDARRCRTPFLEDRDEVMSPIGLLDAGASWLRPTGLEEDSDFLRTRSGL
mmetsp:Transcript_48048/g.114395  ORF Transcript_48048/g.114395 Transcript_48048/m.114395 type:complete len:142 (+) Transcript_48048:437-862(+)